jgi:hypothetical protein
MEVRLKLPSQFIYCHKRNPGRQVRKNPCVPESGVQTATKKILNMAEIVSDKE